jgi:uncharacterized membrane protein HdeD (DUF308 family)
LLVLGLVAAFLPSRFFGSVIRFLGVLLLGSAGLKAAQLVVRRLQSRPARRSVTLIVAQVALDAALGVLLLAHREISIQILALLFGLLVLGEGLIIGWMALRAPAARSRTILVLSALAISGLGLAVLVGWIDPIRWAGLLVGLKLILFGLTLLIIAAWSPARTAPLIYEAILNPEVGELYSVYFGAAFHLGLYIGNNELVHFLDDHLVHRVTWEQFLEGRSPHHQLYPDLPPVPAERIVAVALGEFGKTYPYSLLKFNCEHFAIYCKSGGTTYYSRYAQVPISLKNVAINPLIGMVAELNTRIIEYLAFHMGGPSGRAVSLQIRRLGSAVTAWLLTRSVRSQT